jgi:transcriptional regulator with GAF, ATPase, and Fis domain
MDNSDKDSEQSRKAKELLDSFRKGEEFAQELLKANERLRYRVVELEGEMAQLRRRPPAAATPDEVEQLRQQQQTLMARLQEVEEENKDFARRYVEVEEENNNLANLYVASYQLHSTLDFAEVLKVVIEIIINLIGAEKFAIFLLDEVGNTLQAVATEGMEGRKLARIRVGDGIIGESIQTGQNYFAQTAEAPDSASLSQPLVCVPLKIKEQVLGALVVYSFLAQKKRQLSRVDYELFAMLAGHAATAIFSSKLYSQSERKLNTIQGFIDLLSNKDR